MGDPPQITEVVQRVECEIYDTVLQYSVRKDTSWIVNYVAKVTLALTVTQDGSVAPDFSLLGPFGAGTYSLGLGGSVKASAERIATYAFSIDFSKIDSFKPACSNPNSRLHGRVGFKDWFDRVIASRDNDDTFSRFTDLSHKLDFQLDAGLKLTPAYELLRSKGSSPLAADLTLKHSVDFTMTYNDPNAVDYAKVCIVNSPGPCYEPVKFRAARKARRGPASLADRAVKRILPPAISPSVQRQLDSNTLDLQIRSLRLDQFRR
ncbi:MAG TPA: hypothetical protein VGO01_19910 [Bradyrhizobium sp.]|jgi:hypothetical protein|nr:hypothetical protein [Bradyrhizobium sp.]